MQPLQRQDSHNSLHSWWSDSNSMLRLSPTVNLHAMAKPLMRFMYHRQVLGYIEENEYAPLSAELLDIYCSYLSCKYVSSRTQRLILDHLRLRARRIRSRDFYYSIGRDAQYILCSPVLDQILNIPGAREPDSSRSINALIAALASSNFGCYWDGEPYFQAFDFDLPEIEAAISEVTHVLRNQKGPAAARALLESANTSVRQFTLKLITALMWPDSDGSILSLPAPPVPFVFNIISTVNWAKLLSDENVSVQIASISALSRVAEHPDGSAAIIAANILDDLQHSFDSKISSPRGWAWPLIRSLAQHDFTVPHILQAYVFDKLVYRTSCLFGLQQFDNAVSALHAISMRPEGAAAVLAALSEMDFLNLATLLDSDSDRTYLIQEVCRLISNLAKDENCASVLLRSFHLVAALESLLRRGSTGSSSWNDKYVFLEAASTLIQLHKWSGTEKLRNTVAVIRRRMPASANLWPEDLARLLEEIRAVELTFQF